MEYVRSRSLARGSFIRGSLFEDGIEDEDVLTNHLRAFIFAPELVRGLDKSAVGVSSTEVAAAADVPSLEERSNG